MDRSADALMTVACVFVQGEYDYTPDYVTRLHGMVSRWLHRPFRFVCLTDQPWLFRAPIETIPVAKLPGFAPWTKLELFNPLRGWSGRVLYLDLDSLVVAPLDPIVDCPATFAITADPPQGHASRTRDGYGRQIVRRFNSSVMVFDAGAESQLYTDWRPVQAQQLSGDQDYIGQQLPDAVTLPRAWFPRISEAVRPPWPTEAKVIFCKVPKNAVLAEQHEWFAPLWGAA